MYTGMICVNKRHEATSRFYPIANIWQLRNMSLHLIIAVNSSGTHSGRGERVSGEESVGTRGEKEGGKFMGRKTIDK